jgi:hypothetical protein
MIPHDIASFARDTLDLLGYPALPTEADPDTGASTIAAAERACKNPEWFSIPKVALDTQNGQLLKRKRRPPGSDPADVA